MYYEEKIVGGVLCHRGSPHGEWKQFSAGELSHRLLAAEGELQRARSELRRIIEGV